LGLFSVKLLIEQIGGSIDVDSEEGVGTRFMIRLPGQNLEERAEVGNRMSKDDGLAQP
jgi:signal transduction histidine kinase